VLNCSYSLQLIFIDWKERLREVTAFLSLSLLFGKFQTLPINVCRRPGNNVIADQTFFSRFAFADAELCAVPDIETNVINIRVVRRINDEQPIFDKADFRTKLAASFDCPRRVFIG